MLGMHHLKRFYGISTIKKYARNKKLMSTIDKNGFEFFASNYEENQNSVLFTSGLIGKLSESSVICREGGTVVHAAINSEYKENPIDSSLPLTVDYRSRQYSIGLIPQARSRRERHGGDDEILVARFIDRAVRPLFPKGYVNDIQLTVTTHAADAEKDPTILSVNAASFALLKSKQPWNGPIGCVRIGYIDGKLKINPTVSEQKQSTLDFVYAGSSSRVLM